MQYKLNDKNTEKKTKKESLRLKEGDKNNFKSAKKNLNEFIRNLKKLFKEKNKLRFEIRS